jgi:hypothetical protein
LLRWIKGYDHWSFRTGGSGGQMRHGVRKARGALGVVAILLPLLACCSRTAPIDYTGATATWGSWGGSPGGMRYSPATQITPDR